jgi:hypothetical protein
LCDYAPARKQDWRREIILWKRTGVTQCDGAYHKHIAGRSNRRPLASITQLSEAGGRTAIGTPGFA